jgi:hypothetical protein
MKLHHICLIVSSLAIPSVCGEGSPPVSLCALGGPQIALLQAAASPYKPYIAQLFAAGGKPLPLLDDSPEDHFHHHGLMFGIGVNETDFWAEKGFPNAGRQQPVTTKILGGGGGFEQTLKWLATDGQTLLDESRQVRVRTAILPRVTGSATDTVHWLDWQSVIAPAAELDSVRLTGNHYFGLGMRFLPEWTDKVEFLWPDVTDQRVVRGDEKITPGPWVAARCLVNGRSVTVLMVDHPANSRTTGWFTMGRPFCYLSAALGLDTAPASLGRNERWTLRYGIAVLAIHADPATLAGLAAQWRKSSAFEPPINPKQP